jgi:hypothetical protein
LVNTSTLTPTATQTVTSVNTTTQTPTGTPNGSSTPACGLQVVQILDDRGELVTTLCGNILFPAGTAYSASLSSFAPSPSALGGAITIYLDNQVVAVWNGMSSNGHLVPNGFYHFKITENATDGSIVILRVIRSPFSLLSPVRLPIHNAKLKFMIWRVNC